MALPKPRDKGTLSNPVSFKLNVRYDRQDRYRLAHRIFSPVLYQLSYLSRTFSEDSP